MTTPLGVLFSPPSALMICLLSCLLGCLSFGDAQLALDVAQRLFGTGRRRHDDEREDVGRRVEKVVALADADRLQRRSDRAGSAEQQRRHHTAEWTPAREDD